MSKERALLNKAIEMIQIVPMMASIGNVPPDFGSELILEIKELLAQPEQTEPVYWENEKKALLNEIDHLTNRLAQPELSTDSLQLDEQDLREKPLSEQFISVANQSSLEATRLAFRQGVRFAEKAHGITGGGE